MRMAGSPNNDSLRLAALDTSLKEAGKRMMLCGEMMAKRPSPLFFRALLLHFRSQYDKMKASEKIGRK